MLRPPMESRLKPLFKTSLCCGRLQASSIAAPYSRPTYGSNRGKVMGIVTKAKVKTYDARGEVAQAQYHLLWPNVTININPGFPNLSIDVWVPDGPNQARGFSEHYFGPGVSEQFAQDLIAFSKQVGDEDDALTNSVQHGLLGGIPERGRFLINSEHLCIHFQKLIVNALTERLPAIERASQASPAVVPRTVSVTASESAAPENE